MTQLILSAAAVAHRRLSAISLALFLCFVGATLANAQLKITTQPLSRMVSLGANVPLRVGATGTAPFGYQWYFNGLALTSATNVSLVLTNVQRPQAGEYFVVVTAAAASVRSDAARLDVYSRAGIFDIADPEEFNKIISTNAILTKMAALDSWIEGAVWIPADGGYLVFSDLGNNKLKKLVPPSTLTDFLKPPPNTKFNGNLLDLHENLISCQAGSAGLKVVLTTNGVSVPLVAQYTNGAKFYSPNDLAMKSDGSIWFTDPGYDSGLPLPPPNGPTVPRGFQSGLYVYRFFETNGDATVRQVITNLSRPNGICFSPDETKLYVSDTANTPGVIKVFDVTGTNIVSGGSTLCTVGNGVGDGIKCDADGRVWSSAGDGVEIFAPDGHLVGRIRLTLTANLCFGGPDYKTLYMVGQPYVTSIPLLVSGAVSTRKLAASRNGTQVNIAWPAPSTGFILQESGSLGDTAEWTDVPEIPVVTNGSNGVTVETTNSAKFFRLRLLPRR